MNYEELINIRGGSFKMIGIFAGALIFIIGFIEGLVNPVKCNK